MKITIENTNQIVDVNGAAARVWEGTTERGVRCQLFVTLVAVSKDTAPEALAVFERQLQEQRTPTAGVWPLRMIR